MTSSARRAYARRVLLPVNWEPEAQESIPASRLPAPALPGL